MNRKPKAQWRRPDAHQLRHNRPSAEKRDPKSEYYVPNDPDNRASQPDVGALDGPPYVLDAASIVYQSQLNPAPPLDPLWAARVLTDMLAKEGFNRERWFCSSCQGWDRRSCQEETKNRPPGVYDLDSCNGCLLSHMDAVGPNIKEIRDRLFNEWASLMSKLDLNAEEGRRAQLPSDKKAASEGRKRIVKALAVAKGACELAGFDPAKRRRKAARQMGDAPELGPSHDRTREFRNGMPPRMHPKGGYTS